MRRGADVNGAHRFHDRSACWRARLRPAERKIVLGAYQDFARALSRERAGGGTSCWRSASRRPIGSLPPAELAALTMVANQIFSLDEALNK